LAPARGIRHQNEVVVLLALVFRPDARNCFDRAPSAKTPLIGFPDCSIGINAFLNRAIASPVRHEALALSRCIGLPRCMNRIFCQPLLRTVMAMALLVLGVGLSGCADMSDTVGLAFADPAKYDLYNCKQLETERKTLATKAAELQGLMAKAQTGVAGPVVAESPIATITSPCADKPGSPRKLGSVAGAVPHHRL
jgi:hypothetical protein